MPKGRHLLEYVSEACMHDVLNTTLSAAMLPIFPPFLLAAAHLLPLACEGPFDFFHQTFAAQTRMKHRANRNEQRKTKKRE